MSATEYRFDCQVCGQNVASTERHTAEDCTRRICEIRDSARSASTEDPKPHRKPGEPA